MFQVRLETDHDWEAIGNVHRQAFPTDLEARLVDRLRDSGCFVVSVVGETDGVLAGHVLFSRLASDGLRAVALGPVSVLPAHRRRGLAAAMILDGLGRCRELGYDVAIVLGAPAYYQRFGFCGILAQTLRSPYTGYGEAWMALELTPHVWDGSARDIHYPEPWSAFS